LKLNPLWCCQAFPLCFGLSWGLYLLFWDGLESRTKGKSKFQALFTLPFSSKNWQFLWPAKFHFCSHQSSNIFFLVGRLWRRLGVLRLLMKSFHSQFYRLRALHSFRNRRLRLAKEWKGRKWCLHIRGWQTPWLG